MPTLSTTPSGIIEPISNRRSPYRYKPVGVEVEKLKRCLEAASWAASSYNEQPWIFIVARRENPSEFSRALDCLVEANRTWAEHAGVLILTAIRTTFRSNGKPNRVALHDLGGAAATLAIQASAEGLQAHQMGGVNLSQVKATYSIPEGFEPQTAIALGYPNLDAPHPDDSLAAREAAPRQRNPFGQFVFGPKWGEGAQWL